MVALIESESDSNNNNNNNNESDEEEIGDVANELTGSAGINHKEGNKEGEYHDEDEEEIEFNNI
jgi:hypothetical protein